MVLLSCAILSYGKISTNAILGLLQFVGHIYKRFNGTNDVIPRFLWKMIHL
jgi:hypothetical protein